MDCPLRLILFVALGGAQAGRNEADLRRSCGDMTCGQRFDVDPSEVSMALQEWRFRARLFVQRFWQPTSACMTCMPGSWGNVMSAAHWMTALQTGLVTGLIVLVLSFTPLQRAFRNRFGNAAMVGVLTALADAYSHPDHYGSGQVEALLTGVVSGLLALLASYLLEDRARRIRSAWSMVTGRPG